MRIPVFILVLSCLLLSFLDDKEKRPDAHYKKGSVVTYVQVYADKTVRTNTATVSAIAVTGETTRMTLMNIYINEVGDTTGRWYDHYYWDKRNFWQPMEHSIFGNPVAGMVETTEGDSLVFPFKMKIGATLTPGFKRNVWTSSFSEGVESHFHHNRRVTAIDTVVTKIGNIEAFRIEYKDRHHYKEHDPRKKNSEEVNEIIMCTIWFSPEYGLIKWLSEEKLGTNKMILQSIH